jgi:tetratricopeptide (TPR) repeat protein
MTGEKKLSPEAMEKLVVEASLKARVRDYEEAIEIFEKYLPKLSSGSKQDKIVAASAFSYYGLCIAALRKQYSDAVKYCHLSLKVQRSNVEHYENLGKIHLLGRNRRGAVEAFFKGIEVDPDYKPINAILEKIGRRKDPVIVFLPRDNILNRYLGKRRHEKFERRRQQAIMRRKKQNTQKSEMSAADNRLKKAQARAQHHKDSKLR